MLMIWLYPLGHDERNVPKLVVAHPHNLELPRHFQRGIFIWAAKLR
jgi:hypothetical protein